MGATRTVLVGRDRRCDVRLRDRRVSRRHASIEPTLGRDGHLICDLGSRNGTHLDGRRLLPWHPERLAYGQLISLGGAELWFLPDDPAGWH